MNLFDAMYRNGQWVKFDMPDLPDFADAQRSPDGKCVGIYQRTQWVSTGVDEPKHVPIPAYIAVQSQGRDNLAIYRNGQVLNVRIAPEHAVNLEPANPLTDAPFERVKHLVEVTDNMTVLA